jgi:hypothetical protein
MKQLAVVNEQENEFIVATSNVLIYIDISEIELPASCFFVAIYSF